MVLELTPAAIRALAAARRCAAAECAEATTPRHLLRGLLEGTKGPAAVLDRFGFDLSAWRGQRPAAPDLSSFYALPNDPAVARILTEAFDLAGNRSADRALSTHDLLLALQHTDDDIQHECAI